MNELKEIIVENLSTTEKTKLKSMSELKIFFETDTKVTQFIMFNEKRFEEVLEYSYNCFCILDWQITFISKKIPSKKKKRKWSRFYIL